MGSAQRKRLAQEAVKQRYEKPPKKSGFLTASLAVLGLITLGVATYLDSNSANFYTSFHGKKRNSISRVQIVKNAPTGN